MAADLKLEAYFSEFIGTFFLAFTVGLNILQNTALAPISIGAILMVFIFSTGNVSGAHFNPAVTLGVKLSGRNQMQSLDAWLFMLSQTLAGIVAGFCYWWVFDATYTFKPQAEYTIGEAVACEVTFSTLLVFVVLNVATTEQDSNNHYYGLAIGFTLMAAAFACGPISMCCLNPALAIGAALTHYIHSGFGLRHLVVYLLAPFVGSCIAVAMFHVVRPLEYRFALDANKYEANRSSDV